MRDRDVDDGGVEDFHEGRQHHRTGDDPRVYNALWIRIQAHRPSGNFRSYISNLLGVGIATL
jgi:hypothetical protein